MIIYILLISLLLWVEAALRFVALARALEFVRRDFLEQAAQLANDLGMFLGQIRLFSRIVREIKQQPRLAIRTADLPKRDKTPILAVVFLYCLG